MQEQEGHLDIAGLDFLPVEEGDLVQRGGVHAAGVVDQDVQAVVATVEFRHGPGNAHIGAGVDEGPCTAGGQLLQNRVQLGLGAGHGEDRGARFGEGGG